MIGLLIFSLLLILVMNKMETEIEGIYRKEAQGLLVEIYFLSSGNSNESNDHAHHIQHHVSRTRYGNWYLTGVQ